MKHRDDIAIGDPVEVRLAVRPPAFVTLATAATPPGLQPLAEKWTAATICVVTRDKIGVVFANHARMEIARYSNSWRPA